MSIRARILALALVMVSAIVIVALLQHRATQDTIDLLQTRLSEIDSAQHLSRVIHNLQKERGLSGGQLASDNDQPDILFRTRLDAQREDTDLALQALYGKTSVLVTNAAWVDGARLQLMALRERLDKRELNWLDARDQYSGLIREALDDISAAILSGDTDSTRSHQFLAIIELAAAREKLGLIRATVTRQYTMADDQTAGRIALERFYGAYIEHLHNFNREFVPNPNSSSMQIRDLYSDVYMNVMAQIERISDTDRAEIVTGDAALWWEQSTLVINNMKLLEDQSYQRLSASIRAEIGARQKQATLYLLVSILITLMVVLLAYYTVARILQALSILIKTLRSIRSTHNFGLRVEEQANADEFGQISLSINDLLTYTDKLIQEKEELANTDLLTGVRNRRSFLEQATQEYQRKKRYNTALSVVICDIDHFKSINDTHGHDVGDEVLRRFAQLLREDVRECDVLARWGGEEFIILAPETKEAGAMGLCEKLRTRVAETEFPGAGRITCSFGIAESAENDTFGVTFKRADEALYAAKTSGRNRVMTG